MTNTVWNYIEAAATTTEDNGKRLLMAVDVSPSRCLPADVQVVGHEEDCGQIRFILEIAFNALQRREQLDREGVGLGLLTDVSVLGVTLVGNHVCPTAPKSGDVGRCVGLRKCRSSWPIVKRRLRLLEF